MKLKVLAPDRQLFDGIVDSITVPGIYGSFQILENHADIISPLVEGIVKIHSHTKYHQVFNELEATIGKQFDNDNIFIFNIPGGILEIKRNVCTLLVDEIS